MRKIFFLMLMAIGLSTKVFAQYPEESNAVKPIMLYLDFADSLRNYRYQQEGRLITVSGLHAVGDGGAGVYRFNSTSTAFDDGFNIITPTIGPTPISAGRWIRMSHDRPYKVYTALISQSSGDNPTVEVLENTIGEIVWTRNNVGDYLGTLTGAFITDKTFSFFGTPGNTGSGLNGGAYIMSALSEDIVEIIANNGDDSLNKFPIEIRVYF